MYFFLLQIDYYNFCVKCQYHVLGEIFTFIIQLNRLSIKISGQVFPDHDESL